jgi:hypothetical protein
LVEFQLKIADVIEMLIEDRKIAHRLDQPSAAIRAAELIGNQLGMFVERKEVKTGSLENVEFEQLEDLRGRLVAFATRDAVKADRARNERPENRDVLSGDGASIERQVQEASAILQGGRAS